MKFSTVLAVAATATLASAQLDKIPPCALSCATSSIGETGCALTNFECICKADAFIKGLIPCVQGACSPELFAQTAQAAVVLCGSVGVTLDIPTGASATSSIASVSSVISSIISSQSSVQSVISSIVSEVSSGLSNATSSVPAPTGNATVTSSRPTGATTTSGGPTGTPTQSPNAAGKTTMAMGGLGAAVVAFAAAFL